MLRIGTENKKQLLWLIVLSVTVAMMAIYNSRQAEQMASPVPSGAAASAVPPKRHGTRQRTLEEARFLVDTLPLSQQGTYEIGGRNIFRMQETRIESHKSNVTPPEDLTGTEPKTVQLSTPIPFKFYGFADKSNGARRIFLQDHEDVFVATLGDTVGRHYKVVEVSKDSVTIEDVLHNNRQVIPLTGR